MSVSDIADVPEPDNAKETKVASLVGTDAIIQDIKILLQNNENPVESLNEYLSELEVSVQAEKERKLAEVDKEQLKALIEKHPFFKNPNNYYIRLITVMKYLKKKGVDISTPDMDILVDEIILSIDGVKKRGYGQYSRKKI